MFSRSNPRRLSVIEATIDHKSIYDWEGINAEGELIKGNVCATSPSVAEAELIQKGIQLERIHLAKNKNFLFNNRTSIFARLSRRQHLTQHDLMLFHRHLAMLLKAGLPLTRALTMLKDTTTKIKLTELIVSLYNQVIEGMSLKESMQKHANYFSTFYCSLVHVGERTGRLVEMLEQIANYQSGQEKQKQEIKKALRYPATVLFMAFFITFILLSFVFPKFIPFFKNFNAELPYLTKCLLVVSKNIGQWSALLFVLIGGLVYGVKKAYINNTNYQTWCDKKILEIPLLGNFLNKCFAARFTRTLATGLESGLPILEAVDIAVDLIQNRYYKDALSRLKDAITHGQSLQQAIKHTPLFSPTIMQMLFVGEESSMLHQMLYHIANEYEKELEQRILTFNTLLEPILMIFLGVIMGGLILALYLPIFKLSTLF